MSRSATSLAQDLAKTFEVDLTLRDVTEKAARPSRSERCEKSQFSVPVLRGKRFGSGRSRCASTSVGACRASRSYLAIAAACLTLWGASGALGAKVGAPALRLDSRDARDRFGKLC